jgi:hypothetical protein
MSLHKLADTIQKRGRGEDKMLVHMTPGEVKGLQALAMARGGSLTINPDTGLVEAGFLKNILPMVAGAALTAFSGGMINPLTASMLVGGFEGIRTGDVGKGLMAGLGAYGGAGIGSALTSAGTSAGLGAAATEATAAGTAAGEAALQGSGYEAMKSAGLTDEFIKQSATDFAADNAGQTFLNTAGQQVPVMSGPTAATGIPQVDGSMLRAAPTEMVGTQFSQGTQNMLANPNTTGFKQLGSLEGAKNVYNALPGFTLPAAGMSLAAGALEPEPIPDTSKEKREYGEGAFLSPDFQAYVPRRPNPYYRPTGLGYAGGGIMDIAMARGGTFDDEGQQDDFAMGGIAGYAAGGGLQMKTMSLGEGIARDDDADTASLGAYDAAMKRMEKQYAAGNLKPRGMPKTNVSKLGQMKAMASGGLGGYSDGGRMLKGPGDGMSDSIPGVIGRKQPARLADGEFVVPADVVSHLGNGSTDAGAKRLYAMMDKVRTARTGKKKQAPAVKANRYMPA